jgi:hypothetical protein
MTADQTTVGQALARQPHRHQVGNDRFAQLGTDTVPEIVRRNAIRSPGLERLGVGGDPLPR